MTRLDYTKAARPEVENLSATVELAADRDDQDDGRRRFRMVGYTGAAVARLYGSAVFDLSGIEHGEQVPILFNHDSSEIAGYADTVELTDRGLELSGYLSQVTEAGQRVAALSDEGLQWQASVGLRVDEWEEVPGKADASAEVNGTKLSGPLSIGRRSRLLEVSFVTAGADHLTSAVALTAKEDHMNTEDITEATEDLAPAEVVEAKPDETEALRAELASQAEQLKDALKQLEDLRAVQAEARHPGVGFDGDAREQCAPAKPTTPNEAWESDERLRATYFNHKPAFDAYVRRHGWTQEA